MQPPTGPQAQPVTRRYDQETHYQADAATMAAAGWRVVSVYHDPSNVIVAS
ncbi:MAG TPA: hypothetical protein VF808_06585 [Ktedonobacterales bacterium]